MQADAVMAADCTLPEFPHFTTFRGKTSALEPAMKFSCEFFLFHPLFYMENIVNRTRFTRYMLVRISLARLTPTAGLALSCSLWRCRHSTAISSSAH